MMGRSESSDSHHEPRPSRMAGTHGKAPVAPSGERMSGNPAAHSSATEIPGVGRAGEGRRVEAIQTLGRWARGDDCEHGYYAAGGTEYCPVCFDDGGDDA
jgi:hypothetical protein